MKSPRKPLTDRVAAALKIGPATTDAIAKRVRVDARATGKALSQLKRKGDRAHFVVKNGEAVWKRGKAPQQRASRKR